jgi:beta-lactamase regulating signal transducer with metallopeptidase domain
MIAQLVILAFVVALCCAFAAAIGEWTLSLRRGVPVRWVWAAAMLLSVTVPLVRVSFTARLSGDRNAVAIVSPSAQASPGTPDFRAESSTNEPYTLPTGVGPEVESTSATTRQTLLSFLTIPEFSRRTSVLLAAAWLTTSLALFAALFWSFRRLARDRRSWARVSLHDTQVLLSDGFGPALIGFMRPEIVLPPWVLTLDDAAAKTVLAHEIEHRRAGDSRLIVGAMLVSIAMPWNALLWWMTARLVRAVEFDCDARVVARGVNRATYADLLLGAWQHSISDRRFAFSTAFAERRSKLGQRVNHLLRPEPRRKLVKTLSGATCVMLLAVLAAAAPAPQIAQTMGTSSPASLRPGGPARLQVIDGTMLSRMFRLDMHGEDSRSRTGDAIYISSVWIDSVNARKLFGEDGADGADVYWSKRYFDRVGPQLPASVMLVETLWAPSTTKSSDELTRRMAAPPAGKSLEKLAQQVENRLTSGLNLTPAQHGDAFWIALRYVVAHHAVLRNPELVRSARIVSITDSRDSALRIVLTDDTQRAQFHQLVTLERRFLTIPRAHELADMTVRDNYLDEVPASDAEIATAIAVVERSLLNEAALFTRAAGDSAALHAIILKRTADVRRVLDSDAKRAVFDRRLQFLRRSNPDRY